MAITLQDHGIGGGKKLVGDAQPAHVLAPHTFSNADGNDKVGDMADNGALGIITPGVNPIAIPAGYTSGGQVAGDAALVSGNVRGGAIIYGVPGKAEVIDTTEAAKPATAAQIRAGQIAFVNGVKVTGTSPVQSTAAQNITPGTANIVKAAGIYDGDITIIGDPDLVSPNVKAGANIYGVAGKTEVVDTTEAANPVTASQVETGKVGFVNGVKVIGTGTMFTAPASSSQTYNIPGSYNFTVPASVTRLWVELWGGGGGGGKGSANGNAFNGNGGAGGSYSFGLLNVTPGQTVYVAVGAGGAGTGGYYPSKGTDGGASSCGTLDAPGGTGGYSTDSPGTAVPPGTPDTPASTAAGVYLTHIGVRGISNAGGGAGGGGGDGGVGSSQSNGGVGSKIMGAGGAGGSAVDMAGSAPGGGGAGGKGPTAGNNGASGASGRVIIRW